MDKEGVKKDRNFKTFSLVASVYGGGAILGPILIFAGGGYFLDKFFGREHLFLFIGLALAFVTTNILLYRQSMKIMREMESMTSRSAIKDQSAAKPEADWEDEE